MSAALVSVLASIAAAALPIMKRRRENVFGSRDGLRMVILPSLEFHVDRGRHCSSVPGLSKTTRRLNSPLESSTTCPSGFRRRRVFRFSSHLSFEEHCPTSASWGGSAL